MSKKLESFEDVARFGDDANRPCLLLKIPAYVAQAWNPLFEKGEVSFASIQSAVPNKLSNGDLISFNNTSLKISGLRPPTIKMRVISSEVGLKGSHVKYEGVICERGDLIPTETDQSFQKHIRDQALSEVSKPVLESLTTVQERQAMLAQNYVGNVKKGGGSSRRNGDDDDDDENEEEEDQDDDDEERTAHASKSKSRKSSATAAAAPAAKKMKKDKKEPNEYSSDEIRSALLACFEKNPYWLSKNLRLEMKMPFHAYSQILKELTVQHMEGEFKKHFSLKSKTELKTDEKI